MIGSVALNGAGSLIVAGMGSAAEEASYEHSVQRDGDDWLGSGSGVGLEWSSVGQTIKKQSIILQHPLHTSGKILLWTIRWHACLTLLTSTGREKGMPDR